MASVCGGAVVPAILGNVADKIGTRKAMVVPLAFFVIAWSFPIYLNLYKAKELDAYRESKVGLSEGEVDPDSRVAREKDDVEAHQVEIVRTSSGKSK